jgi:hypothetical protein
LGISFLKVGISVSKKIDEYVKEFCIDSLKALKEYDEKLKTNIEGSKYQKFYSDFPRGIFIRSITEPVLKFIIFSSLCKKHKMFPEASGYYKGKQLLDLALSSPFLDKGSDYADIAIEMKWGRIKKTGEFAKWSLDFIQKDLLKLHKFCTIENKYMMQFMYMDYDVKIDKETLKSQILYYIDKRKFRNKEMELIYDDYFETCELDLNKKNKFFILLWKIK